MKKFSKILCSVLVLVMLMSSNVCAYKMYSLDGRSVDVNYDDAQAWRNVGWYDQPVQQVYSLDGRTEIIYKSQFAAWKSVGWYDQPVQQVYALDGRTEIIYKSQLAAWKSVGWYEEPVQMMYAPDGRTAVVAKSQVNAWKKVGWYTYPVKNTYTPSSSTNYKNEYAYILKQKLKENYSYEMSFSLIYIDNDSIPELVYRSGEYHAAGAEVFTFTGGKAVSLGVFGEFGDIYYLPYGNRFTSQYWGMGAEYIALYKISGRSAVELVELNGYDNYPYGSSCYTVNNKNVTYSSYISTKKSYGLGGEFYSIGGSYERASDINKYSLTTSNINYILG